jgi:hypothetical protein
VIERWEALRKLTLCIASVFILYMGVAALWESMGLPTPPLPVKLMAMVALSVGFVWALRRVHRAFATGEKRRGQAMCGAKGDDVVGRLLAELPDDYHVFHDLSRLCGDIDHIVIGPTGLFIIETKAHGGKVSVEGDMLLVNGHPPVEKDLLAQSWRNAYWVHDLLQNTLAVEIFPVPLLVFAHAFVSAPCPVKGVRVLNKRLLLQTILKGPHADLPIARVIEVLRQKMGATPMITG